MIPEFVGEEQLREGAGRIYPPNVAQLSQNVYLFEYFGIVNGILVVGETSCVLIDPFDTDYSARIARERMNEITDKPIETIIYTHLHSDHTGGAAVFADTVKEVIAHASYTTVLEGQEKIQHAFWTRLTHQAGLKLSAAESVSMGLSPVMETKGELKPLDPTLVLEDERSEIAFDGTRIVCIAAPGETDETQYVWLPDEGIVCCGDNYYASWPNLSALRGSQYRSVAQWAHSLSTLYDLHAQILVPGHGQTLRSAEEVDHVIGNYRDAISWVLEETLRRIDEGQTPDQIAESIQLPDQWRDLPFLQEYYGTVAWSARGIFAGYLGWYDGNPTTLNPLPAADYAKRSIALAGGADRVLEEAQTAVAAHTAAESQWALELCDLLLAAGEHAVEATRNKALACAFLARTQTSANGRHYYLSVAKDLDEQAAQEVLAL